MSNLSKLKLGKFVATIVALSSISAILSTANKAEAFPAPTTLPPGSSVRSNNQCFSLNAQADGNLVLYKQSNGQALWHTATYGRNVKQTIFQTDGNLVIYNTSNQPVWASNTDRRGITQLNVQDDGNVVMYNSQNQPIWATNTVTSCGTTPPPPPTRPANSLINNTIMPLGSSIKSNNQCFSLNAQADGNLVIYRQSNGQALWNTATYGRNVKQTIFQNDGNLVIYNTSNSPVWASNTDRRSATRITLQDDGNFVMYNAQNQALWATNTVTSCSPPANVSGRSIYLPFDPGQTLTITQGWNTDFTHGKLFPVSKYGLDFVTNGKTGIGARATRAGTIVSAGVKSGEALGNTVIVQYIDGNYGLYAHLNSIWVREGQSVAGGQGLGEIGKTGSGASNVIHLHYEQKSGPGFNYNSLPIQFLEGNWNLNGYPNINVTSNNPDGRR
jgi:murein DD-endopeptidase MepM/ murein hydrolase activator NlpD